MRAAAAKQHVALLLCAVNYDIAYYRGIGILCKAETFEAGKVKIVNIAPSALASGGGVHYAARGIGNCGMVCTVYILSYAMRAQGFGVHCRKRAGLLGGAVIVQQVCHAAVGRKLGIGNSREGQTLARDSAEGIAVKPRNGGGIDAQKAFTVLREPAKRQGVYIGNGFFSVGTVNMHLALCAVCGNGEQRGGVAGKIRALAAYSGA